MKAYVFPGQGAQFTGMGKDLYDSNPKAKELIDKSNDILGFNIREIMFNGSAEDLKQTKVTQPAVFIHSVVSAAVIDNFQPDMVAGHSLGEFSALVAAGAMSFEDGLRLVYSRAMAMQKACEATPSTMAAILGLADNVIENICKEIDGIVVPANYNCPGQLVISGTAQQITINVPEGYIAYYSMDGSEPSPDGSGSYQYSEPVNMPEGSTIFSAVLVDKNNRLSDVTKRNYELVLSEE